MLRKIFNIRDTTQYVINKCCERTEYDSVYWNVNSIDAMQVAETMMVCSMLAYYHGGLSPFVGWSIHNSIVNNIGARLA